jgi:hypothetical protein
MKKSKVKFGRIVVIVLVIIGSITVLDNTWRLGREMGSSIIHVLKSHQWKLVVVN